MQLILVNLANLFLGHGSVLGSYPAGYEWLNVVTDAINYILTPALILACSAGAIYAIVIGVKMAQADDQGKRDENRKRLINIIVSIVAVAVLILLFNFLKDSLPGWLGLPEISKS